MKKLNLSLLLLLFVALGAKAQIPNGGFENWTTVSNDWHLTHFRGAGDEVPTVSQKYQPGHSGNYAVKLTSRLNDEGNIELEGALASWKPNPTTYGGGFPCTQKPSKISFYAKHDLAVGDSASVWIYFTKNGVRYPALDLVNLSNNNIFTIGGTSSDWKYYEFNIKGLTVTPDTVFYAIFSGNLKIGVEDNTTAKAGSYIIIDDVAFDTGAAPHGDFEEWGRPVEYPNNYMMWGAYEVVVDCNVTNPLQKTTDAHSGSYAMKATTYVNPYESNNNGVIGHGTYGDLLNNKEVKFPCTTREGVFTGWYKYIPASADTAFIELTLYKNGTLVGATSKNLYAVSAYTGFYLPFSCTATPDSALVRFSSSNQNLTKNIGSTLYLDDLAFAPTPTVADWHNYDANVAPDNDGWTSVAISTIANPANATIAALSASNNYLSCVADSTHANAYTYGSKLTVNTPMTVMFRAKSSVQSGPKLGGYFEIDLGPSYSNIPVKLKWNTSGTSPYRNVILSYTTGVTSKPIDFSAWHVYRITFDGDSLRLYIDETGPFATAKPNTVTSAKTSTYALKIAGSSIGNFASGDIDWISWNYQGAYTPDKGVLPTSYYTNTTNIANTNKDNSGLTIFPNPTTDAFQIDGLESKAQIIISDLTGKVVLHCNASPQESVSINALPQGMYLVKITTANSSKETRLIKK